MSKRPFLSQIDQHIEKPELGNAKKAVFILHDQLNLDYWPDWVKEEKPLLILLNRKRKGAACLITKRS